MNKYPYFFKYRYKKARDDFKKYEEECNSECKYKFRMPLDKLLKQERHTTAQLEFLSNYYKYMPLVYSDSPMNLLCRYIEQVDFEITKKLKETGTFDYTVMIDKDVPFTDEEYAAVIKILKEYNIVAKAISIRKDVEESGAADDFHEYSRYRVFCETYLEAMADKLCNMDLVTNCLVKYFYEENPKANRELFWDVAGQYIFEHIKKNLGAETVMYPFLDPDGDITYLNKRYTMREVSLSNDTE